MTWKYKILNHFPTQWIEDSRLIRKLWRFILILLKPQQPFEFKAKHYKLIVNPNYHFLTRDVMRQGTWERFMTSLFLNELRNAKTVLDIGANFGHYTMLAANYLTTERTVFAFEPDPETFGILKENLKLSPESHIMLSDIALGDANEERDFFVDRHNFGGHSLAENNVRATKSSFKVKMMKLDDFLVQKNARPKIDLIKIDVQGAEAAVLKGAMETIRRDKPTIFCEFWPQGIINLGMSPEEFLSFFFENGYSISVLHRERQKLLPCVGTDYTKWPLFDTMDNYEVDTLIKYQP